MLVYAVILSVLIVILSVVLYLRGSKSTAVDQENRPRPVPNRIRDGPPRRAQMARNRGARLRANAQQQQREDDASDDEREVEDDEKAEFPEGKIGAKKMAKLQAKAEKKAQREADEQMRQEKKKKEQQAAEDRKKQEEKEKAEELKREEEERLAREEKERKEHEEYLRMKEAFTVEEEGCEHQAGDEQNLLQEFVSYIKSQKVVVIEDLAAKFKLKTQAAIDRLKDLQADDILTGVIDDRGKFIYVSQEEMEAVAKFIRQRGRVSIAELAENSNQLINLTPTTIT